MSMNQQDVMEDLAYAEAEGPADLWEDEADYMGQPEYFSEDDWEGDGYESDLLGEGEGEDDYEADEADEFISRALGGMLGAEDEDEFFGKLLSGAKALLKKAKPFIGKIARGAAPILSMIPHPAAQVGAQVANALKTLKAEGASTEDALEAVAEIAVRDPRALPIVAGLAARSVLKNRGAAMPPGQRQQVAKTMTRAAGTLIRSGDLKGIRALPKIIKSVKRTAAAQGTPAAVQPRVVASTANKVARNPNLMRRLSMPSPTAQRIIRRNGRGEYWSGGSMSGSRTITVPGPATITITVG